MKVIKRYKNRKLYDTVQSRYVTVKQAGDLLNAGYVVIDQKTGKDITLFTYLALIEQQLKENNSNVTATVSIFTRLIINS